MRILFLDDNPIRHRQFKMMTIGQQVDHVTTSKECIHALMNNEPYGLVCLDHDLGGQVFQIAKENSGTEVAEFIRNELPKDRYPKSIIVHSWNPDGAQRMMQIIAPTMIEIVYRPFKPIPYNSPLLPNSTGENNDE